MKKGDAAKQMVSLLKYLDERGLPIEDKAQAILNFCVDAIGMTPPAHIKLVDVKDMDGDLMTSIEREIESHEWEDLDEN